MELLDAHARNVSGNVRDGTAPSRAERSAIPDRQGDSDRQRRFQRDTPCARYPTSARSTSCPVVGASSPNIIAGYSCAMQVAIALLAMAVLVTVGCEKQGPASASDLSAPDAAARCQLNAIRNRSYEQWERCMHPTLRGGKPPSKLDKPGFWDDVGMERAVTTTSPWFARTATGTSSTPACSRLTSVVRSHASSRTSRSCTEPSPSPGQRLVLIPRTTASRTSTPHARPATGMRSS